ncbi:MAG: hypothetical protein N2Z21_03040 [Candidatus Sumerlaeaceae bacterium]|nr:hypothetical protein [Candidatus Sumerlaeaceae bacterium]
METKTLKLRHLWRRYWPEITTVAAVVVSSLGIVVHALFLPPTRTYLGFVQVDQPVYYACAREYFENGNGLFAANPYSYDPNAPRQYSHLYFLLVGWLWRLSGLSFSVIDGGVRLLLAPAFLILAAMVFRTVHRWRAGANPMLAVMLLGGGLAWLTAIFGTAVNYFVGRLHESKSGSFLDYLWFLFISDFRTAEGGYGDWHVQLFRNFFYAPEVFYHFLFFGSVVLFLRGHRALGCLGVLCTWWAHPYTGLELALICIVWFAVEWWQGNLSARRPLLAVAVITALFAFYYGVWLPRDPEHRSVYEQMKSFPAVMLPSQIVIAYGLLIPLSMLAVVTPSFRNHWRRSEVRLVVVWAAVAIFLNYHDKIFPWVEAVQPLHFSHGYLYAPLAILATFGLRILLSFKGARYALRRIPVWAVGVLLLHLPDNIIWTIRSVVFLPATSIVFAPPTPDIELLQALDKVASTETIVEDIRLPRFGVISPLIPVLTHHRVVGAHFFNSPDAKAVRNTLESFRNNATTESLRRLRATAVLTSLDYGCTLMQRMPDSFETSIPLLGDVVLLKVRHRNLSHPTKTDVLQGNVRNGAER